LSIDFKKFPVNSDILTFLPSSFFLLVDEEDFPLGYFPYLAFGPAAGFRAPLLHPGRGAVETRDPLTLFFEVVGGTQFSPGFAFYLCSWSTRLRTFRRTLLGESNLRTFLKVLVEELVRVPALLGTFEASFWFDFPTN